MLILLAKSRGSVRQSRLERSNAILRDAEPFSSLGDDRRARIIAEQALIVDFEPDEAVQTLPALLPEAADRKRAIDLVQEIAGELSEMNEGTVRMLVRLRTTLGLEPLCSACPPAGRAPAAARREEGKGMTRTNRTFAEIDDRRGGRDQPDRHARRHLSVRACQRQPQPAAPARQRRHRRRQREQPGAVDVAGLAVLGGARQPAARPGHAV